SVGTELQQGRPVASSCSFGSFRYRFVDSLYVHSIHRERRNIISFSDLIELCDVGSTCHRSPHGVAVVFNYEDHRGLVEHRKVERFVNRALTNRTIAHVADCEILGAFVFLSPAETQAHRNLRANDPVTARKISFFVKDVHRTAFSFGRASRFAIQLCHDCSRIGTQSQRVRMTTVSSDPLVILGQSTDRTRSTSFLSNIKVTESPDFLLTVKLSSLLLKPPH